jgi:PAS domain S-box/PAS domain S-box
MELECADRIDSKDSDSKYRIFFECALDIVFLVDITGKIIDANYAAVREYGYSRETLISLSVSDLRAPADRGSAEEKLRAAYEKGEIYETVHRRKDGSCFPVEISLRGIVIDDSKMLLAVVRNITRRKEAERNLARIAAIVESSDDAILGMTPEGIITEWNHGAEVLYDYSTKEMVGKSVEALIPREHTGELAHIIDMIKRGNRVEHFDTVRVKKDGTHVHVSLNVSPIRSQEGELLGISWTARDITNRKKIEEELEIAKRRAELYLDLMGHDINNMNQIAMGFLEIVIESFTLSKKEREYLDKTMEMLRNSAKLIENVRKLQKVEEGSLNHKEIDLYGVIQSAIADYSSLPGRKVTVRFRKGLACCVIANELVRDVFSNLIGNAIKHSEMHKPLEIDVRTDQVTEKGKDTVVSSSKTTALAYQIH